MNLPEIVRKELDEEAIVERVGLGGDDALYVTSARSLRYRGEGLLSEESVESIPHGAERIVAEIGRRTARLSFTYGLDGDRSMTLPADRFDDALEPILDGAFAAAGVTDPDESVLAAFRFSDLTLAITDARLVKHVGEAVWDAEHERFRFADVTDLAFEEGSVATAVVLTVDGRRERFKAPNESARAVRERLEEALCAYHGVDRVADLPDAAAVEASPAADGVDSGAAATEETAVTGLELPSADEGSASVDTEDGVGVGGAAVDGSAVASGDGESGGANGVGTEVAALRAAVERQNDRLRRQEELLERLIDELGRRR